MFKMWKLIEVQIYGIGGIGMTLMAGNALLMQAVMDQRLIHNFVLFVHDLGPVESSPVLNLFSEEFIATASSL